MAKRKNITAVIGYLLLAILLLMGTSASGRASIRMLDEYQCADLIAGKTTIAGTVCSEVSGEHLVVTYTVTDGWELTEANLWVNLDLVDMPQSPAGSPDIVDFPHRSGDISAKTGYQFLVPLKTLGTEEDLCDPDKVFYISAHAVLQKGNGKDGYLKKIGWGSEKQIIEQTGWAFYYTVQFTCNDLPPEPKTCASVFALGDKHLRSILNSDGDPITGKWGWQITVDPGDAITQPIFAGAGGNDISNWIYVGDLKILYSGSLVIVEYHMIEPYTMNETHLYADTAETPAADFGQFGNWHDLTDASEDVFAIEIRGDSVYIVAHAVVCRPNE